MSQPIYHLLPYSAWQRVPPDGVYAPESLEKEGFVHFSGDEATLLAVANAYYHDVTEPMAVLLVDPDRLSAKVRWEPPSEPSEDQLFPHVYGPVERHAVLDVKHVVREPSGRYVALVDRPATAKLLDLVPYPQGGWYRRSWTSPVRFTPAGYTAERPAATTTLYLLRPGEQAAWHRVPSDELWFWHSGDPVELRLGGTGVAPGAEETTVLGPDVHAGHLLHTVVPQGTWQSARLTGDREVLVSRVVAPGYDTSEIESAPRD